MSVTRLLILGVGFVAAIISAMLAVNLTSGPSQVVRDVVEVPSIETDKILVATKRLSRGEKVEGGSLAWREWPAESISERHITRASRPNAISELSGSTARFLIEEGDPVQNTKFVKPGESFMASVLPKGKRAVSTSVSPDTGAGGFILPDDKVDVLMTRSVGEEGGETVYSTETVLKNIRVLAIDQVIQEQDGQPVVVGSTATLELSEQQANALTVAQQLADRITLALRSLRDAGEEQELGAEHLLGNTPDNSVRVVRYGNQSIVRTKK